MRTGSRLFLIGVAIVGFSLYAILQLHFAQEEHTRMLREADAKSLLPNVPSGMHVASAISISGLPHLMNKSNVGYTSSVTTGKTQDENLRTFLSADQVNLVQDRFATAMAHLFPLVNLSSLESSVLCREPEMNRSCVFRNLYWYEGTYWLFVVGTPKLPNNRISFASKYGPFVQMAVRSFKTSEELTKFVLKGKFLDWSGVTLIFALMWHHNVGHALFDGLWPAFVALLKFNLHNFPFRALIDIDAAHRNTRYLIEDILDGFCGGAVEKLYNLSARKQNIRLEVAVGGSNNMGQRYMNAAVSLPGGRELDASRLFRNRMYAMYGVSKKRRSEMIGIIIRNRRFSETEEAMFRGIRNIDGMPFEYLDWASFQTFKAQLEKIVIVGVHVSSIGTGQMYQTFLSNGAVHVNLGTIGDERQALIPWFMEQYMAEGAPYIRALYYNSSKRLCGLDRKELDSLLKKAIKLHRAGFLIPVPAGANLSPEGKIFRELCLNGQCQELLKSMNPTGSSSYPGICARDAWAEYVIYEQGGWSTSGWKEHGVVGYCPVDRTALHRLRSKYNLAPLVPHGGKVECQDGSIVRIRQPDADRLRCTCSQTHDRLFPWELISNGKVCFEIALLQSRGNRFFYVKNEAANFPDNAVIAEKETDTVSSFRIKKALNPKHHWGFSLESCKHPGHYLRHMNGRVIVSRPAHGSDPDAGWFRPKSAAKTDTCGMIGGAYNDEMFIDFDSNTAVLERAKGTCLEFRMSLEHSVPPPLVKSPSHGKHNVALGDELSTLPDGVTKDILKEGVGRLRPRRGDKTRVHYVCTLARGGKPIDSSRDRNHIFTFTLGQGEVISGWDIGVATMRKGEHARLALSPQYAYGDEGNYPDIPSGAGLVFDVELLDWTSTDPFHCFCTHSPVYLPWKSTRDECFQFVAEDTSLMYLSVHSEGTSYPKNEVFAQLNSASVVSVKVVDALNKEQHAGGAFSLQSCRHSAYYLLHSNGKALVSQPSTPTDKDTGWLLPQIHDSDTCGMLRPFVDDSLALKLTLDIQQLEKRSGTCLHWRRNT